MRLHGAQSGVAQRHRRRWLCGPGSAALGSGCRCSSRWTTAPASLGGYCLAAETGQHTFGNFQLIELIGHFCPLGVDPSKPIRKLLLLLSNFVQCRHSLISLLFARNQVSQRTGLTFCNKWRTAAPKKDHVGKILGFSRLGLAPSQGSLLQRARPAATPEPHFA